MTRSVLSTLPGKLAAAAAGLTFATTGLAAASALPGPIQQAASDVGNLIGIGLPTSDGTTTTTDGTTTPPTGNTTPTTEGTGTTTPTTPTTGGPTTSTTVGSTTPSTAPAPLPAAATTAAQAAQIHAFDQACGNHGAYVSYVARNGTEPSCAAGVRTGSSSPTTTVATPEPADSDGANGAAEVDGAGKSGRSSSGPDHGSGQGGDNGGQGPKRTR